MTKLSQGDSHRELQKLHDRGWVLVRLRPREKRAFEKGWQTLSRAPHDFMPHENVGVRFGQDSGGLVDIDLDVAEARHLVGHSAFGLSALPEFGRSSLPAGERGHRLAIAPDAPDRSLRFGFSWPRKDPRLVELGLDRPTVLEVRATGQTAFPPSIVTRTVAGREVPDPLVWSEPAGPFVSVPQLPWVDLERRAGVLAFSAFAAALMRRCLGDEELLGRTRLGLIDIAAAAEVYDPEAILRPALDVARRGAPRAGPSAPDPEALLEEGAEVGMRVRSWLGLKPHAARTPPDARPFGGISAEDLEALLEVLDPCDFGAYFAWRDLLFACHNATRGSDPGREVFVNWSAGNPEYWGPDWNRSVRAAWKRCSSERPGRITIGTLLMHVDAAGYPDLRRSIMARYDFASDDLADAPVEDFDFEGLANKPMLELEDDPRMQAPLESDDDA